MSRIWMPGGGGGGGADLDLVTALAEDLLEGKVIIGPDGEPLTGTLALTGNAADSQVLAGKTYYNTDAKTQRTGTMPQQAAATYTPGTANQTIAAGRYLAGAQTIRGDANLVAGNILYGKSIFGVAGNVRKIAQYTANFTGSTSQISFPGYKPHNNASFNAYYITVPPLGFTPVFVSCTSEGAGSSECATSSRWGMLFVRTPGGNGATGTHWTLDRSVLTKNGGKLPVAGSRAAATVNIFGYY